MGATASKTDLGVRAASALVMFVIAGLALYFGGMAFAALLLVVGALTLVEWFALLRGMAVGQGLKLALRVAGPLLIGGAIAGLWYVRDHLGVAAALWILGMVWATDIGGYGAGRAFGGARLAPSISPGKTWSGLIGAMLAALVVSASVGDRAGITGVPLWIGLVMGLLAQMGDLGQSWMKRKAGVKDSGKLIPGHGGVFDRVDGLIPVAFILGGLAMLGHISARGAV